MTFPADWKIRFAGPHRKQRLADFLKELPDDHTYPPTEAGDVVEVKLKRPVIASFHGKPEAPRSNIISFIHPE